MLDFVNDYSEGCFPEVLKKLGETNFEKTSGYGLDDYSLKTAEKIKEFCECPEGQVYFLSGGTQSNQVVIDSLLDVFDGVVTSDCGHINVHEAGAIEYTGHKVMALPARDGKLDAGDLKKLLADYYADDNYEHMVRPGMVYISHPTEVGTIYSKKELREISDICREYEIPLYLDGARLACALTAAGNDVSLQDIARYTDAFYIGGTKCGALYGEAVVFTHGNMPFRFNTRVKQHGAMLAKGRILSLQFHVLFEGSSIEETLYYKGGVHANKLADRIKKVLGEKGYRFYVDSPTNQVFIIAGNEWLKKISDRVKYSFFEKYDEEHTVVRFCTSWATSEEDVEELTGIL